MQMRSRDGDTFVQFSRKSPRKSQSGIRKRSGAGAQVLDAAWQVADQPSQQVDRGGLNI